ncbi:MAG: family 10 glycosylhydrolase [Isosphaeraceae bacterium]
MLPGGPRRQAWLDWRRDNITKVVKAVSEQVRAIKPKVKLSAAVFRNWPTDRDAVGQDWKLWCERGYLDFVCPMDYTASTAQFDTWVSHQREWAGQTPCYPGIGSYLLTPEQVIGQIQATRRHEMRGFTVFNYDTRMAQTLLPRLSVGTTRRAGPGSQPR